jgi:CHAT domain-containing protein
MKPRFALLCGVIVLGAVMVPAGDPPPREGSEQRFVEADRRFRSGSYLRAQRILEELEAAAHASGDRAAEARALRELGRTFDARGDHATARGYRERALGIARSLPDGALEASVLLEEAFTAWGQADYDSAVSLARAARSLQETAGDIVGQSKSVMLLGQIEHKHGAYSEAIRLEREALALAESAENIQAQADIHQGLGAIFLDLRSFAAAERQLRLRLALVRALGDPAQEAHALNYSGIVHQAGGDLEAALVIQDEAVRVAMASRDEGAWSHALHARGSVYRDLGMYDEAKADYAEAIRLRDAAGDPRSRAWSLAGLGRIEKELSRSREALAAYQGAVAVFAQINDRRALAWHLYEVARLQAILGESTAARGTYERVLAEMNAIELPYMCVALADYGLLLAEAGEAVAAADAGRKARERADATGNPEMRWTAAHGNGRILRHLNRRDEALASILDAIAIIEGMKPELLPSDAAKSGFFEERQAVYEDAASLLVDLGRPEQALEIAERARARAFLDLLGSGNGAQPAPTRVPDMEDGDDTKPVEPAAPHPASPGVGRGGMSVTSLATPVAPIPSDAVLEPLGLAAIREEARLRDAPIIEYFTTSDRLLGWLVSAAGEVVSSAAPVGRAELLRDAEAARSDRGGDLERQRLYRRLVEPFARLLPAEPSHAILVIPHGPLFLVSLAGLPDAGGRYVAERHAIAYSPSISVLRYLRLRAARFPRIPQAILVVGNPKMPARRPGDPPLPPLPGADEEAEAACRAWPEGTVTMLRGDAAGEAAVRRLAPGFGVIHFATHGIVRANDPMRSALVLSPDAARDPAGDGFLTVREIFDLRLAADLVILSGCDTGLGRINADGVMGLGRAFLFAGATSVVATLWRVADRVARREMELFHRQLRRGIPTAEALRRAQVSTLGELRAGKLKLADGTPIAATPALWAAFVVAGDPH